MRTSIKVEGMTCVNCVRAIDINLRKLKGVKDVQVSFELGYVYIEFDENILRKEQIKEVIESLGYRASQSMYRERLDLILLLTYIALSAPLIPLMLVHEPWSLYVQFVLASFVQIFGGYGFYRSAYWSLLSGVGNMDMLVAIGSTSAYLYSLFGMLGLLHVHPFFETSALLITFVKIGKYLENRAKEKATRSLKELFGLQTSKVRVIEKDKEVERFVQDVFVGDIIVLKTGEVVPLDVVVFEGTLEVDESLITGESIPVLKDRGEKVLSGSFVISGYAKAKVEKRIGSSYVSFLMRLVEDALKRKPKVQRLADRVSHHFVQFVVILSFAVFTLWYLKSGDFQKSFSFGLSVLVVSCPCAFGIAVPLSVTVGLLKAYRKGLLVKNPEVFERLSELNLMIFDKTGTLTEGKYEVTRIEADKEECINVAYSLSKVSNHPYAKAIKEYCREFGASEIYLSSCKEVPGKGVYCDGYFLGNPKEIGMDSTNSTVVLAKDGKLLASFHIQDRGISEKISQTVKYLKKRNIKIVMVTGDGEDKAKEVAKLLGIDSFYAKVSPEGKLELLELYQKEGYKVGMVGDGINDAPSMAKAYVSFAVGSGADVTKKVCDVVLLSGSGGLKDAFELGDKTYRRIRQNIFWALIYNLLSLPIAGGLLSTYGIVLKPEIAGLMMALSSLSVVLNSVRR
ncbi:MAG: heavy metal translocating P-type ATPase [Aquificaceae bacterium]